jgi:hypothetical protein
MNQTRSHLTSDYSDTLLVIEIDNGSSTVSTINAKLLIDSV